VAYNNICAAYNQLQQWDQAIAACQRALVIQPDFELAKNNLAAAQAGGASPAGGPTPTKSYADYINDSLAFYTAGDYQKSVEAAQAALQVQPDSAVAYNNICAAYNQLKHSGTRRSQRASGRWPARRISSRPRTTCGQRSKESSRRGVGWEVGSVLLLTGWHSPWRRAALPSLRQIILLRFV